MIHPHTTGVRVHRLPFVLDGCFGVFGCVRRNSRGGACLPLLLLLLLLLLLSLLRYWGTTTSRSPAYAAFLALLPLGTHLTDDSLGDCCGYIFSYLVLIRHSNTLINSTNFRTSMPTAVHYYSTLLQYTTTAVLQFHDFDLPGTAYVLLNYIIICMIQLMPPGGSRIICTMYHKFPGLDVHYVYRSCSTFHSGRLGSIWSVIQIMYLSEVCILLSYYTCCTE